MESLKAVMNYGSGALVGLLVGLVFAEWVGSPNTAAYLMLVVLTIIVFAIIGRIIAFLASRKKE